MRTHDMQAIGHEKFMEVDAPISRARPARGHRDGVRGQRVI
jgi:hypothetical protein